MTFRRWIYLGVGVALGVLLFAGPRDARAAGAAAGPVRTVSYSIGFLQPAANAAQRRLFRDIVAATLNDPRGWSVGGSVRFREVRRGGSFQVTLAPAATVGRFGACSAAWSCRVGFLVLINEMRWNDASAIFPVPVHRHAYRQLVINHEVGHALGFGHPGCPRAGGPAAVMQQQSKSLGGCTPNPWPTRGEQRAYAARLGVRVQRGPAWLAPGMRARGITIGNAQRAVRARLGEPQRRRTIGRGAARRVIETFVREQVTVELRRGLVAAVTTRNRADVTLRGIGVGTRAARVRALRGITCWRADQAGRSRCRLGAAARAGDRSTTFLLRGGRVTAVRVARRSAR